MLLFRVRFQDFMKQRLITIIWLKNTWVRIGKQKEKSKYQNKKKSQRVWCSLIIPALTIGRSQIIFLLALMIRRVLQKKNSTSFLCDIWVTITKSIINYSYKVVSNPEFFFANQSTFLSDLSWFYCYYLF